MKGNNFLDKATADDPQIMCCHSERLNEITHKDTKGSTATVALVAVTAKEPIAATDFMVFLVDSIPFEKTMPNQKPVLATMRALG